MKLPCVPATGKVAGTKLTRVAPASIPWCPVRRRSDDPGLRRAPLPVPGSAMTRPLSGEYCLEVPDLDRYLLLRMEHDAVSASLFVPRAPGRSSGPIRRVLPSSPLRELLEAYFSGIPVDLDTPLLVPSTGGKFTARVREAIRHIPTGSTVFYGDLAGMAGSPGAWRAAGRVCSSNTHALFIPCHRVVARDGIGGYRWGIDAKLGLLRLEGVPGYGQ